MQSTTIKSMKNQNNNESKNQPNDPMNVSGKLFGVGVGPGDPEDITLKACRIMRESDMLAVPAGKAADSAAYRITCNALPELRKKPVLEIDMPMTRDPEKLERAHAAGAELLAEQLRVGKQIAFLTIGDPTVYSTYIYLHERIKRAGFATELISGVPSFAVAAAALNCSLVEGGARLSIEAGKEEGKAALKRRLQESGTHVIMKSGRTYVEVVQILQELEVEAPGSTDIYMVENCGYPEERCYFGLAQLPESAPYFSLLIVKRQ